MRGSATGSLRAKTLRNVCARRKAGVDSIQVVCRFEDERVAIPGPRHRPNKKKASVASSHGNFAISIRSWFGDNVSGLEHALVTIRMIGWVCLKYARQSIAHKRCWDHTLFVHANLPRFRAYPCDKAARARAKANICTALIKIIAIRIAIALR